MKTLWHILLLTLFSALTGAALVAHRPAKWAPDTRSDAETEQKPPLGVLDQLSQAAIKRSAPFNISEARLNAHLQRTVRAEMEAGAATRWLRMEPPEVDLQEGRAALRLRWLLAERHACDLIVNFSLQREDGDFRVEVIDGAYGRLKVPRGLLHPAREVLRRLVGVLRPELDALFAMNQIQITGDRLRLDPRFTESPARATASSR